ncbi:MAG: SDR family NAD(P)-dependent oxidoreductase, partial [Clostridiales bacterium]|nr:SDR family NAD(P)-dependent oxidoreductase [Clostridiales bacterium]
MEQKVLDFTMDKFSLKGKVAIVTGGNTTLGMAYATAFAKAGADIFLPHFTDDIDEVKEAVEKEGRKIEFFKGNLLEAEYRNAMVAKCMEVYGKIDILVNNAGASTRSTFEECPEEAYHDDVELLLNVGYYLCRSIGKIMREQGGGKIINIGSALSFRSGGGNPSYTIAKTGVLALTRAVAVTYRNDNIQCNAICPGFFSSAINNFMTAERSPGTAARLPRGEMQTPDELMGAAI